MQMHEAPGRLDARLVQKRIGGLDDPFHGLAVIDRADGDPARNPWTAFLPRVRRACSVSATGFAFVFGARAGHEVHGQPPDASIPIA